MYPSSLTDDEWGIIKPLIPARDLRKGGRPGRYHPRMIVDSILYALVSGCQWDMLPHDLIPADAAHRWLTLWRKIGLWTRIHTTLRDRVRQAMGRDLAPTAAVMDAQSVKTSEGGVDRGYDAGKKVAGRKRYLIVDTNGLLLDVIVVSASVQDPAGGRKLLENMRTRYPTIKLVWTDQGFANSKNQTLVEWAKDELDLVVEVVQRPVGVKGFVLLHRRWVVERTNAWITAHRRLARDYERLPENSEAFITIAMIRLMLRRLTGISVRWSNRTPLEPATQTYPAHAT